MPTQNAIADLPLRGVPSKYSRFYPSGRIWPSGDFSLGYTKSSPDERLDCRHPGDNPDGWFEGDPHGGDPLVLVNASNSHKTRTPRGINGITGFGRKMLKSAVTQLFRDFPHHRPTFATLTLPDLPREIRQHLSANWAEVVRQTIQYLTRCLKAARVPQLVISCSEFQPKRLLNSGGEAYLHLHLVWPNPPRRNAWAVDVLRFQVWFTRLISRLADYPLPCLCNCDLKMAKSNCAFELAKYLSKGGAVLGKALEDLGPENMPHTYWNLSKAARDKVKSEVKTGRDIGSYLESCLNYGFEFDCLDTLFARLRNIDLAIGEALITVGWSGELSPDLYIENFPRGTH